MKLYAPNYYQKFACIADKCRHSCCIGWEIDIDADTMQKYVALSDTESYGKEILQSIEPTVPPHFRLDAHERCPHLDKYGLCRIIQHLSEDHLCEICREHPRFYHTTADGIEVGIGMACEEAARLILSSDDYTSTVEIARIDDEAAPAEFDARPYRAHLYSLLSDRTHSYPERLRVIIDTYGVSPTVLSDGEWRKVLASLEYLDDAHQMLFSHYSSTPFVPKAMEAPLERALAYFIFRHCSNVCDAGEFYAALGFALFCERLLSSIATLPDAEDIVTCARIVSEELEYSEENTEAVKRIFSET